MQIRIASIQDIPEIVSVLQQSLGETKLPKSAEIWAYKHLQNPFGESLVFLAEEGSRIVGVRAFMKWEWWLKEESFKTLRAVDTGILPEFQRKGVFTALNGEALKYARMEGFSFIFNTPNSKSLHGNLKMGWQKVGRIGVKVIPAKTVLPWKSKRFSYPELKENSQISATLMDTHNNKLKEKGNLYTAKNESYLKWRYQENPLQKYIIFSDRDFFVAAYVKKHKYFSELRVAEHIFINNEGLQKIYFSFTELSQHTKTDIISYSSNLNLKPWEMKMKIGPVLLGRNLSLPEKQWGSIINIDNWDYSLGDLELF